MTETNWQVLENVFFRFLLKGKNMLTRKRFFLESGLTVSAFQQTKLMIQHAFQTNPFHSHLTVSIPPSTALN